MCSKISWKYQTCLISFDRIESKSEAKKIGVCDHNTLRDFLWNLSAVIRFVYQIMSQWFIIVIRVVIKSSPNESWRSSQVPLFQVQVQSFSLFSQASHKSLNLRLESESSQVMWLESPTSGIKWTMHGERQVCWGSDRSSFLSVIR